MNHDPENPPPWTPDDEAEQEWVEDHRGPDDEIVECSYAPCRCHALVRRPTPVGLGRPCLTCGADLEVVAASAGVSLDPLACYCGPECDPAEHVNRRVCTCLLEHRRGDPKGTWRIVEWNVNCPVHEEPSFVWVRGNQSSRQSIAERVMLFKMGLHKMVRLGGHLEESADIGRELARRYEEALRVAEEDKRRLDWVEANAYAIETRESGSGHKPDVPLRDWIDNALTHEQQIEGA